MFFCPIVELTSWYYIDINVRDISKYTCKTNYIIFYYIRQYTRKNKEFRRTDAFLSLHPRRAGKRSTAPAREHSQPCCSGEMGGRAGGSICPWWTGGGRWAGGAAFAPRDGGEDIAGGKAESGAERRVFRFFRLEVGNADVSVTSAWEIMADNSRSNFSWLTMDHRSIR